MQIKKNYTNWDQPQTDADIPRQQHALPAQPARAIALRDARILDAPAGGFNPG
jgi:hypothetical protein